MAAPLLLSQGYSDVRPLGKGTYGQVFQCFTPSGEQLAVKVALDARSRAAATHEAQMMTAIPTHKNLLPLISISNTAQATLMTLPLADGGDSLKFMMDRNCTALPEADAHGIFSQLLSAVEHMHSNGFVHRDIKCENILLSGMRRRNVQLADFGFTTRFRKGCLGLVESVGSVHYSAPEICSEVCYEGPEVDIWSMGVVLYAWTTGRLPFGGNNDHEIRARVCNGIYTSPQNVSAELADLIRSMLTADTAKRITLDGIREHSWMASFPPAGAARRATSFSQEEPLMHIVHQRRNSTEEMPAKRTLKSITLGK